MSYDVFISYARHDGSQLANRLAQDLRAIGLHVFWDQDSIPAGANWEDTLDNALDSADTILVVLTPYSVASEEVTAEWRPMLSKGKAIIPLMHLPCEVPRRLSMRQYIDFQNPSNYQVALAELVDAINNTSPHEIVIELSGEQLMQRGKTYFENGQRELAARDYLLALRDPDPQLRARAARFLRESKVPSNFGKVLDILHLEEHPDVLANLLITLIGHINIVEEPINHDELVRQLTPYIQHVESQVRREAIRVFAYGSIKEAVPLIVERLLTDDDVVVRTQAALSLGRLPSEDSAHGLFQALNDHSVEVREAAVNALGVHGDPSVIPHLKRVTQSDKEGGVRQAARDAINRLTS